MHSVSERAYIIRCKTMTTGSPPDAFRDLAHWHNTHMENERKELVEAVKKAPIPPRVLERLKNRADAQKILMHHPGYYTEDVISSLWRMREVLRRSWRDLQSLLDDFDRFCKSEESTRPSAGDVSKYTQLDVQKELFCLSCASKAIVDVSRKITKRVHIPQYEDKINGEFSRDPQHNFVVALRNNLNHGVFFPADWIIVDNYMSRATSSYFIISKDLLLMYAEDFNEYAMDYIMSSGNRIDIRKLFSSYTGRVEALYDIIEKEIHKYIPADFVDYRRCALAIRQHVSRCWLGIIIHQLGTEPYGSLNRFLSKEQIEEIMSLPSSSADQVDRIIQLLDGEGGCTSELREQFYQRFGVEA